MGLNFIDVLYLVEMKESGLVLFDVFDLIPVFAYMNT